MLMITDNEEFYEQQKPLSLQNVKELVNILKEALWQLLWVIPSKIPKHHEKSVQSVSSQKRLQLQGERVSMLAAELLAQLQDWNCRQQFTSPNDFHAHDAVEGRFFYTQAGKENPIARELLKRAPFLVPFSNRVQICTSLLASAREQNRSSHTQPFIQHQIRIRHN
jgi:ubiquitin-protein ligase E3 C